MKNRGTPPFSSKPFDLDLDALLHPAQAFEHPQDVVSDPDLTLNEKRALLASWASDACAVEARPLLRHAPGGRRDVSVADILEALRSLDREANEAGGTSWVRRQVRRRSIEAFRLRRSRSDQGSGHGLSH
jgi:hypothetical protein